MLALAADALSYHLDMPFMTYDAPADGFTGYGDNDCAPYCHGAWWYNDCSQSNLNGEYNSTAYPQGINWYPWHSFTYSLKTTAMKIRPAV